MFRYVICHISAQHVSAHAGYSKVNASEDARVGDLRYCVRETSKRTSSGTHIRRDGKRRILSKRGGEDERSRATHRGMARWILGMRGSAARKEVQPWYPGWVRVRRDEPRADRSNRPPENVAVLAIPASDCCVSHRDIQQGEQMRILRERQPAFHGKLG